MGVPPINLASYELFVSHPWVSAIAQQYDARDSVLAYHAKVRAETDLETLRDTFLQAHKRCAFGSFSGRVKERSSFLRKLYRLTVEGAATSGVTQETLNRARARIHDICGMRVSCAYFDEIERTVNDVLRPELRDRGYMTTVPGHKDKNYLDEGDRLGYRSYHFFVKVPAFVDVFGASKLVLCEFQVRSELQHVWAEKSHTLFYKPKEGWDYSDDHVLEDMRQLSHSLRVADQLLVSIRDRVRGHEKG